MSESENQDVTVSDVESLPVAKINAVKRGWWVWVIPGCAMAFAVVLVVIYVVRTGPVVTVKFGEGHGVAVGDVVRCLGIEVGKVEEVKLIDGLKRVEVVIRLDPEAKELARQGSRFWVVKPRVGITGVSGLETVIGPRYIKVLPGDGQEMWEFEGLDEEPVILDARHDGLEIKLTAMQRGSLRRGSPVLYRQTQIGVVTRVGLAGDSSSVEAVANIRPEYVNLVRVKSVFWNVSGFEIRFGLREGLQFDVASLESLLEGGVAMATPPDAGEKVSAGHVFDVAVKAKKEWLEWRSAIGIGGAGLPGHVVMPEMVRLTVRREEGAILKREVFYKGWGLVTKAGLIGPAELLKSKDKGATLEVLGKKYQLSDQTVAKVGEREELSLMNLLLEDVTAWEEGKIRKMEGPEAEDCVVVSGEGRSPIALAARKLKSGGTFYDVDRAVNFGSDMSGAAVLSVKDGAVVGMLVVTKGKGRVVGLK